MVLRVWDDAESLLAKSFARLGDRTPDDALDRLLRRRCDLWGVYIDKKLVAAAITSIRGRTAVVETVGGIRMREWVHLLHEFEGMARDNGMTGIEIEGRVGWTRLLPDYRVKWVGMDKAL